MKSLCLIISMLIMYSCAYIGNGLSMVDDNQFIYKDRNNQGDFFKSDSVVILMRRREDVSCNFYLLLWKNGHLYHSFAKPIDGSFKDLCLDNSGYKGRYYFSGDTLYTEIITGDMEHLFRTYIVKGDVFEYVSFKKQPRFRKKAIRQKLYSDDISNGSMIREYPDSTLCEKLKHSFW